MPVFAQPQTSSLWGVNGEKWDKTRIADYTNAGYRKGREPIPAFPVSVNIKTLGAKGDGVSDDRPFIQKAIRQCAPNGTVFLPKGIYVLNDSLQIGKSGICLRGESRDGTVLFFKRGLEELYPKYNGSQSSWSWEGAMLLFTGNISEVGIENLTVRFPDSIYVGHNWHERGYNGIGFAAGVKDAWLRNITLLNADLGIYLRDAQQVSCLNFKLAFLGVRETQTIPTGGEKGQSVSGHHGVNCYASYNLFHNFEFTRNYFHHLSVEPPAAPGRASYNVFSQGKLPDARFDHHTSSLRRTDHNLWTDIDAGEGSDIYNSSGATAPPRVFLNETFWNIQGKKSTGSDPDVSSENNNFIAVGRENLRTAPPLGKNPFVERIPNDAISPRNLYWAQMKLLHGIDPSIVDSLSVTALAHRKPDRGGERGYYRYTLFRDRSPLILKHPDDIEKRTEAFDLTGRLRTLVVPVLAPVLAPE
ncbi:MAG: Pectate lyase superfamily protein [Fibrobacteres bacterium]|nr:Pectate lyase superfamily protein [Fibrobacterota bacterium]